MATHQATLRLGPADHGRAVSAEEFAEADYTEPWKYERVDGSLVVMSPDSKEHDDCSEPLRDYLGAYRLVRPDVVQEVVSKAWVRVNGGTDRIGDVGVFLKTDRDVPPRPDRVPELMFEIVSPDRTSRERDYVHKRAEYHKLGVLEYVIVDRFVPRFTVLTHTPTGYAERVLAADETYTSPLLPGLEIPLADVF